MKCERTLDREPKLAGRAGRTLPNEAILEVQGDASRCFASIPNESCIGRPCGSMPAHARCQLTKSKVACCQDHELAYFVEELYKAIANGDTDEAGPRMGWGNLVGLSSLCLAHGSGLGFRV